jgi:hypothetical protein
MKYWIKYFFASAVMLSFLYCSRVTEKVEQKVNEKIDEKVNETMKKIDSSMGNINLDSIKKKLDSLNNQFDTTGRKAAKKKK